MVVWGLSWRYLRRAAFFAWMGNPRGGPIGGLDLRSAVGRLRSEA
jgi:hypothetical protein